MQQIDSRPEESIVSTGILSPSAEALFSEHVVGGQIFLPGVGYLEMMFAATRRTALKAIAFIRPCVLPVPRPDAFEKCILRCTRRGRDAFEIASWRGVKTSDDLKFSTHFSASFVDIESESIAPTHISERRSVTVKFQGGTYEEKLAAGKYPAATNTGDFSFSLKSPMSLFKAVLHARGLVARGARWAHRAISRFAGERKLAWHSRPCTQNLQNTHGPGERN